jgi:hypothetical protein
MTLQNIDGVLTGRGLMDCLQYYDNCLLYYVVQRLFWITLNFESLLKIPYISNPIVSIMTNL